MAAAKNAREGFAVMLRGLRMLLDAVQQHEEHAIDWLNGMERTTQSGDWVGAHESFYGLLREAEALERLAALLRNTVEDGYAPLLRAEEYDDAAGGAP